MPEQSPLPRLGRRGDVQGLRALAVTVVVLAHLGVPWMAGGYIGVDVFFVVSGFLISSLLLREATTSGRVRLGSFYARRARRILPAAGLVLVATSVVAAFQLSVSRVMDLVQDVRWAAVFAANVHFARIGTDYFQEDRAVSPVQHFWSLAVEEQFYLVWPAVVLAVFALWPRRPLRVVTLVVVTAWVTSLAWSVLLTARSPVAAYFSSATRAWELATGALLALAGHHLGRQHLLLRRLLASVGLGAILASVLLFSDTTPFPGWRAAVPVLGTAALLAAGADGAVGAARVLDLAPVRYVGDISYSLYLWHWPVLVLGAGVVGGPFGPRDMALMVAVTVVLSVLSYHMVENPVRRARLRVVSGRRSLALWPVVLALVLGSSSWAGAHATGAFEKRVIAATATTSDTSSQSNGLSSDHRIRPVGALIRESLAAAARGHDIAFPLRNLRHLGTDVWQHDFECYATWGQTSTRPCPLGDKLAQRTVVLYGDSHAGMWLPPLANLGKRRGFRLVPLIKLGCSPFDVRQTHGGVAFPECGEFRSWALNRIAQLHPDTVLLAYRSLLEVSPPEGQTSEQAWSAGVASTVRALHRLAPDVAIISDVTSLDFSPADCLTAPHSTAASCIQREVATTTTGNSLTHEAARHPGARFVDVTGLVCARRKCPLVVDHIVTYRDSAHISKTWSMVVRPDLARLLELPPRNRPPAAPRS